ncbi:GH25 family lysozyme [Spirillospora sp. NPDC000708]
MKRLAKLLAASAIAGGALLHLAAPSDAAPSNAAPPNAVPSGAAASKAAPSQAVEQSRPLPQGVDVSTYDRGVDWGGGRLAFGIAKATEGTGHDDATFPANWAKIRQNGLVRGAYHYGHPKNDPVREADHFLSAVTSAGLQPGDLLMLDLETTDGRSDHQVNAWAKRWLEHVQRKTGVKAFFYSSWSFAQEHGDGLGGYPLWVAHYGKAPGRVTAPSPWKQWTIHQYASTDHDHNVSRLAADRLRGLGYNPSHR